MQKMNEKKIKKSMKKRNIDKKSEPTTATRFELATFG